MFQKISISLYPYLQRNNDNSLFIYYFTRYSNSLAKHVEVSRVCTNLQRIFNQPSHYGVGGFFLKKFVSVP